MLMTLQVCANFASFLQYFIFYFIAAFIYFTFADGFNWGADTV